MSIFVKEIVADTVLLIFYDGVYVHILNTLKDIGFHKGIGFFKLCDQLLGFQAFAGCFLIPEA